MIPLNQFLAQRALAENPFPNKKFTNPKTGNKVLFTSLPPEEQARYRKKLSKKTPEVKHHGINKSELEKKYGKKISKDSPINYDDKVTPKTNPKLFVKLKGEYHRLNSEVPTGKRPNFKYAKPEFNPLWEKNPDKYFYAKVPKIATKTFRDKEGNFVKKGERIPKKDEYVYTLNHMVKNGRIKFASSTNLSGELPKTVALNNKIIKENPLGTKEYAAACAFGIQLATSARVSTGALNLKKKNFKFGKGGELKLDYIGKDNVHIEDTIIPTPDNVDLIKGLKKLYKRTKTRNDPVITWDKAGTTRKLSSEDINGRPRSGNKGHLGNFPWFKNETSHRIRTINGGLTFSANAVIETKKLKPQKEITKEYIKKVHEAFMRCVTRVSEKLHNKPAASMKSYIDPTLMKGFWNQYGIKDEYVPKGVYKRFAESSTKQKGMFEDVSDINNMSDFHEFLKCTDLTNEPPIPENMEKSDLNFWI